MRNTRDTLQWLRGQRDHPSQSWYRLCLGLATAARAITPKYPTAYSAWVGAVKQHPLSPDVDWHTVPHGAPIFYKGPVESGVIYGHVATYIGVTKVGPLCWTNDALRVGGVNMVSPLWFISHWDHPLLGWTGDLNGVDLGLGSTNPPPPPAVTVSLASVQTAARLDPRRAQGGTTPGSVVAVRTVEQALVRLGYLPAELVDGSFGTRTIDAYRAWQHLLGYGGASANGVPGTVSLHRLGHRYGFHVVA